MPWIKNVSLANIEKGQHPVDRNAMLIQIVDPDMKFPTPVHEFAETYRFQFLDLEAGDNANVSLKISDADAAHLVTLLQSALVRDLNVIVHCVAGVCRSGAVCEVGIMMGFDDTKAYRSPNLLVKHKMMKVLGWTYDENEPYTMNGVPFEYDELGNKKIWVPKED